ncbi:MAG: putative bifunctional diguanylate cyclase/phosphodiesterase, partial [Desulfosalsimonas sp.]
MEKSEEAILVAEDVRSSRRALVSMLQKQGFSSIYEAQNGQQAVDMLRSQSIDLVLLDIMMPEVDGFAVLKAMKADVGLRLVPVIMITAIDDMDSAVKCIEMGAEDYLIKPFNPVMLRARITASLEKKRLREIEKEYLRMYDSATGLPNRRYFTQRLTEQLHRSQRHPSLFAVLAVRIGKYPAIFETLGRKTGDRYIFERAGQLKKILPDDAVIARTGEQTFGVILFDLPSPAAGNAAAKNISETLASPVYLEAREFTGNIQVGVAYNDPPYSNAETMLRDAGLAAGQVDTLGGFKIFDDTIHQAAIRRLELEPALRQALENNQLIMHYQPIVSLQDGGIKGYEALVRWQHPEKGIIMPDEFIRIAEETGLIIPLGSWVIHEVCRQAACWQNQGCRDSRLTISVNVSARQFTEPAFLSVVQSALQKSGIQSSCISLELTESALIENSQQVTEVLDELRRIKVRTSLDDFGTGYCSLNYLHQYPFDTLKIDQCFVRHIDSSSRNQAIVSSTIELAHRLGMQVVAEGIETEAEMETLKQLNCEYGQGW